MGTTWRSHLRGVWGCVATRTTLKRFWTLVPKWTRGWGFTEVAGPRQGDNTGFKQHLICFYDPEGRRIRGCGRNVVHVAGQLIASLLSEVSLFVSAMRRPSWMVCPGQTFSSGSSSCCQCTNDCVGTWNDSRGLLSICIAISSRPGTTRPNQDRMQVRASTHRQRNVAQHE